MSLLNSNTMRSWLYNFFLKVLHKMIQKAAEKAVGSSIENLLNHVCAPHLIRLLIIIITTITNSHGSLWYGTTTGRQRGPANDSLG